jgi:hypothetical protein
MKTPGHRLLSALAMPLDAIPQTRAHSAIQPNLIVFNGVGVNAGDWNRIDASATGPLIDEFRFGTTYASVAPIDCCDCKSDIGIAILGIER